MRLVIWIAAASFTLLLTGCDTSSNIDDPNKSYFLKYYGNDGDQTGEDLVAMSDGSIVLFGTTQPSGQNKFSQWYLVKADAKGNILWEHTYGGPFDDEASDIELTNDGRLVAVGNSFKSATDRDVKIMTFTLDGVPIDSALVGLKNNSNQDTDESAETVSLTNDGFIVAGSSSDTDLKPNAVANDQRDAIHLRFFNNLTLYPNSWGKAHGPGTYDVAIKVIQISTSQYYLFGYSNTQVPGHPNPDINYWIFGLGANGGANTADLFIGDPTTDERLSSLSVAPIQSGDGYFLGGITYNSSGGAAASDVYVARLRKTLAFNPTDLQFQKPLSIKLGNDLPEHTAVYASKLSGFYVLANEKSFNDNQNWLLTKLNNDGSIAWNLPLIFGGEGLDACGAIEELPDGRILLLGTMRTGKPDAGEMKMTLIKLNQDGKFAN